MNGAAFPGWIGQFLAPDPYPGDIVSMDDVAAHKAAGLAVSSSRRARRGRRVGQQVARGGITDVGPQAVRFLADQGVDHLVAGQLHMAVG